MRADATGRDRNHSPSRATLPVIALLCGLALGGCKRKEDRFTEAFAAQMRRGLPDARITIKEPLVLEVTFSPDGGTSTVDVDNSFRDCRGELQGCDAAERRVRALTQSYGAGDGGDPATVRPTLKDVRWMASAEEVFKAAPPDKLAGNRVVTAPFVADIVIVYVFDTPDGMRMMSERDRQKLGLAPAAIDALARKNLDAAAPGALPSEEIEPGIHQVHVGDSYEASRLLLDDRWKAPAGAVKGDLLVAAPTRDFLLYTGSQESDAVLTRFRTLVREYEHARGHPISRTIMRRTPAGWQRAFAP